MSKCTKIIDVGLYGRPTHEFDVVDEWPVGGYVVWNIGRRNFPHPGYLPLAQVKADYHIVPETLKALYVGDESLCLEVLHYAGYHTVSREKFNEIKGARA